MLFKREPVLFSTVVRATIVLLTAFGLKLDAAQIGAIMLFTEAVLGFIVRNTVTSPATMENASQPATPAIAG